MVSSNIIFMIVGIIFLLDSMVVLLFPNWTLRTVRKWMRSEKSLKRIATIELIIALLILLIGINI